MTARNCDALLGLDLHGRKPDPKDEGEIAFYQGKDDRTTRILKITRPNEDFRVSYLELASEQIEQEAHIPLKLGQLRAAQLLVEYALPSLLGWNTLYNPSIVGGGKSY